MFRRIGPGLYKAVPQRWGVRRGKAVFGYPGHSIVLQPLSADTLLRLKGRGAFRWIRFLFPDRIDVWRMQRRSMAAAASALHSLDAVSHQTQLAFTSNDLQLPHCSLGLCSFCNHNALINFSHNLQRFATDRLDTSRGEQMRHHGAMIRENAPCE
jgi:hypothetical protein